jgi:hypothetical protein
MRIDWSKVAIGAGVVAGGYFTVQWWRHRPAPGKKVLLTQPVGGSALGINATAVIQQVLPDGSVRVQPESGPGLPASLLPIVTVPKGSYKVL